MLEVLRDEIQRRTISLEFAHQRELLFNQWCTSQEIGNNNFEKLPEKIGSCIPFIIKAYLEEQKVEELHRAATLVDGHKLTDHSFSSTTDLGDVVSPRIF